MALTPLASFTAMSTFSATDVVLLVYVFAVVIWLIINWYSVRRLWQQTSGKSIFTLRPDLSEPVANIEPLKLWVQAALGRLATLLEQRTAKGPFVTKAVDAIRQCAGPEDGLGWGKPHATGAIKGTLASAFYVKLNLDPKRSLFWALMHEAEHHRFAACHDAQYPSDNLMLRDCLGLIGMHECARIEFMVCLRSNPRLHLMAPIYYIEIMGKYVETCAAYLLTRVGPTARRVRKILAGQQRWRRRW